jgi:hypothetical protein
MAGRLQPGNASGDDPSGRFWSILAARSKYDGAFTNLRRQTARQRMVDAAALERKRGAVYQA